MKAKEKVPAQDWRTIYSVETKQADNGAECLRVTAHTAWAARQLAVLIAKAVKEGGA